MRTKHDRRNISSDDLGLLLDALNRRLGVGLEAAVSAGAGLAYSEEELIEGDPIEHATSKWK